MSEGQRIPLAEARAIAEDLVALLMPAVERIEVCGSIRRQAATCGDIDLVVVQRIARLADMFGNETGQGIQLVDALADELCGQQVIRQARRSDGKLAGWGPKLRKFTFRDMAVQCQHATADTVGAWMVIRTGPSGYSHAFVTPRGQKAAIRDRDGQVTRYRPGTLPPGFTFERDPQHGGFRLHRAHQFVPTPNEHDVYEALGLPYVPPEKRS